MFSNIEKADPLDAQPSGLQASAAESAAPESTPVRVMDEGVDAKGGLGADMVAAGAGVELGWFALIVQVHIDFVVMCFFLLLSILLFALTMLGSLSELLTLTFTGQDYLGIFVIALLPAWAGFTTAYGFSGPLDVQAVGAEPNWGWTRLRYKAFIVGTGVFSTLVAVGMYCLINGALYVSTLFIMGVPFGLGFAEHSLAWLLRRRINIFTKAPNRKVSLMKHRVVRASCAAMCVAVLAIFFGATGGNRFATEKSAVVPAASEDVLGIYDIVQGGEHTRYQSFELHAAPDQVGNQFDAHASSSRVVMAFFATPVEYDHDGLACLHKNDTKAGYLITLHDNGVLGFVGRLYTDSQYSANSTILRHPSIHELACFAQVEDGAMPLTDILHGAIHGCFCYAVFTDLQTMQRYNRWSWDLGFGWRAVRRGA